MFPPVSNFVGRATESSSPGTLSARARSPMDAVSVSLDLPPVLDLIGATTKSASSGSLSVSPQSPVDPVSVILDLPTVAGPVGTTTVSGIESGGTIKSVLERLDRVYGRPVWCYVCGQGQLGERGDEERD